MASFLIIALAVLGASNTLLSKKFQTSFSESLLNFAKYNLLNAFCACFFLFAINNFRIEVNLTTFLYSLIYALVVICALTLNFFAYKFVSVSLVNILSTSGSIILSTLFTIFFLGNEPTVTIIISVVSMVIASIIPHFGTKGKLSPATIPICLAFFFISGASPIVLKLFTIDKTTTDSGSLFILTNVVIVVISLLVIAILALLRRNPLKEIVRPFSLKTTLNVIIRTLISNVSSVISVFAIQLMSLTVYTTTTSALGAISAFLLSVLYFKEKTNLKQILAVVLSVFAIILSVF